MSIRLIINADDYGYFPWVNQGIVALAAAGKITATGILANSADLSAQLQLISQVQNLDAGAHLTLTSGKPLTDAMAEHLAESQGAFADVYSMTRLILSGRIPLACVRQEWQAQIAACGSLSLHFLNSHEHIHMLPPLFKLCSELAAANRIPFVRLSRADALWPIGISAWIRSGLMQAMYVLNRQRLGNTPELIGLSQSGCLNYDYLRSLCQRLQAGKVYELMCHPGLQPTAPVPTKLANYHAWQQEFNLLQSDELNSFFKKNNIKIIGYSDLR